MSERSDAASAPKEESIWLRLVFILLFVVIFNLAEAVLWAMVVVQFLVRVVTGRPLPQLTEFGGRLAAFLQQVIRFLTFGTDGMPWPFAPWPDGADRAAPEPTRGRRRRRTAVGTPGPGGATRTQPD